MIDSSSPLSLAFPSRVAVNSSSRFGSYTAPATVPAPSFTATLTHHWGMRRGSSRSRRAGRQPNRGRSSIFRAPSSPTKPSCGRRSASNAPIARSDARSASLTRSVGVLFAGHAPLASGLDALDQQPARHPCGRDGDLQQIGLRLPLPARRSRLRSRGPLDPALAGSVFAHEKAGGGPASTGARPRAARPRPERRLVVRLRDELHRRAAGRPRRSRPAPSRRAGRCSSSSRVGDHRRRRRRRRQPALTSFAPILGGGPGSAASAARRGRPAARSSALCTQPCARAPSRPRPPEHAPEARRAADPPFQPLRVGNVAASSLMLRR